MDKEGLKVDEKIMFTPRWVPIVQEFKLKAFDETISDQEHFTEVNTFRVI